MALTSYVVAIGSNRWGRHGAPVREVAAAIAVLAPSVASPIVRSAPIGPSTRRFANAVAIIETDEAPDALLARLKGVERDFGRRRGRRWGARVIDLDIVLWSGGCWSGPGLTIPHQGFRTRDFVLVPMVEIAPGWRDPVGGRTVRQLRARLPSSSLEPRARGRW